MERDGLSAKCHERNLSHIADCPTERELLQTDCFHEHDWNGTSKRTCKPTFKTVQSFPCSRLYLDCTTEHENFQNGWVHEHDWNEMEFNHKTHHTFLEFNFYHYGKNLILGNIIILGNPHEMNIDALN